MANLYISENISLPNERSSWLTLIREKYLGYMRMVSAVNILIFIVSSVISKHVLWSLLTLLQITILFLTKRYPNKALVYMLLYQLIGFIVMSILVMPHFKLFYMWILYIGYTITSILISYLSSKLMKIHQDISNTSLDIVREEITL